LVVSTYLKKWKNCLEICRTDYNFAIACVTHKSAISMENSPQYPFGISSFLEIWEENYLYVDKAALRQIEVGRQLLVRDTEYRGLEERGVTV
jgi:hypothetical protein